MSVISGETQEGNRSPDSECALCGEKLHYPFLTWTCHKSDFNLCGKCCERNETGLIADLIQSERNREVTAALPDPYLGTNERPGYPVSAADTEYDVEQNNDCNER
jgi:hypothetical protein